MKRTAIISILIVVAVALWLWSSGQLNHKTTPTSVITEAPGQRETPQTQQVTNGTELARQAEGDRQQAAESIAERNQILLQMKDKGELVGRRLDAITQMIGAPTSVENNRAIYRLDTGFGGSEWIFEYSDGVITSVLRNDLD